MERRMPRAYCFSRSIFSIEAKSFEKFDGATQVHIDLPSAAQTYYDAMTKEFGGDESADSDSNQMKTGEEFSFDDEGRRCEFCGP
jgi:hypothetical protein